MEFFGFLDVPQLQNETVRLHLVRTAEADPVKGWVPAYHFEIRRVPDDTPVGICDLRIGYNTGTYWGGNIGYTVWEAYRGHHYAAAACPLLFRLAKTHGMPHVLIAVNTENIPSQRVCERLGGERLGPFAIPEDNDRYYLDGERETYLYRFDLSERDAN